MKVLSGKRRRRRGKPPVETPYTEECEDRNQEFRCMVRREQPFRSTSNDVAQVTNRWNVDFQFLFCAPPLPSESLGAALLEAAAGTDDAAEAAFAAEDRGSPSSCSSPPPASAAAANRRRLDE